MKEQALHKTWSICPVCMKRIPAERIQIGNEVFLRKNCNEHGTFQSIIWRGRTNINEWIGKLESPYIENPRCPDACGLCNDHLQETCCVLLNITNRCNLNCRFCFENTRTGKEPTFEEIKASLVKIAKLGKTLVQLSGGEPTERSDLPEIIRAAKRAGIKYVQLNTNGIRLGEDKNYVKELGDAQLSFVFMQFDGTNDLIYQNLRGKALLNLKKQAIENCGVENIGVTLVPTLVPNINTDNIGQILHFAISQVPHVRGVHFQPVSFIGRVSSTPVDNERITLDEVLNKICMQSKGLFKEKDFIPSRCNHPLCGFHGDFLIKDTKPIPLIRSDHANNTSASIPTSAEKKRDFVARRWQRQPITPTATKACCNQEPQKMETFLNQIQTKSFTITAMAFQDAGNFDISRVRKCSLHVFDNDMFVPFCAYYLSKWDTI